MEEQNDVEIVQTVFHNTEIHNFLRGEFVFSYIKSWKPRAFLAILNNVNLTTMLLKENFCANCCGRDLKGKLIWKICKIPLLPFRKQGGGIIA